MRTPFPAIVSERLGHVGEMVAPGSPLVSLIDTSRIEVRAEVQAADVASLRAARGLQFHLDGAAYPLQLIRLSPAIDPATRLQQARLRFTGPLAPVGGSGRLVWRTPRHTCRPRSWSGGGDAWVSGSTVAADLASTPCLRRRRAGLPAPRGSVLTAASSCVARARSDRRRTHVCGSTRPCCATTRSLTSPSWWSVMGLIAYLTLPREQDPEINFNWIALVAVLPGAGAEDVERKLTAPLEDAIARIPDIRFISSVSREGVVNILVRFRDIPPQLFDKRVTDLRREVQATAERELPAEVKPPRSTRSPPPAVSPPPWC